ncbi:hypothetical protein [Piscirickettsia salmonis]|uniref:hypothetical protein n=1 Tax=Piscirickettsia salmonis TaxID=1238 RepID=UPI0011B942D0|nr:hypothetical protein [Piscirickettsia salmonis]
MVIFHAPGECGFIGLSLDFGCFAVIEQTVGRTCIDVTVRDQRVRPSSSEVQHYSILSRHQIL